MKLIAESVRRSGSCKINCLSCKHTALQHRLKCAVIIFNIPCKIIIKKGKCFFAVFSAFVRCINRPKSLDAVAKCIKWGDNLLLIRQRFKRGIIKYLEIRDYGIITDRLLILISIQNGKTSDLCSRSRRGWHCQNIKIKFWIKFNSLSSINRTSAAYCNNKIAFICFICFNSIFYRAYLRARLKRSKAYTFNTNFIKGFTVAISVIILRADKKYLLRIYFKHFIFKLIKKNLIIIFHSAPLKFYIISLT